VGCLLVVLLGFTVLFAGIGFVVHLLWVIAAVFFVFWLAGYGFARGRRRGARRR
jgi:hypothetical protein